MHIFVLLSEFFQDIKKQKMRAFLTTFAITWGTLAVILLMSFGSGLNFRMRESLLNAGDRIITVYGSQTRMEYQGLPVGRRIRFTERDIPLLKQNIPEIGWISAQAGRSVQLRNEQKSATTHMEGVYPQFKVLRRMYPQPGGRFINDIDLTQKRRVVFLGSVIAEELFGTKDPIGQRLDIDGVPFKVIGVLPSKLQTSMNNGPDDRRAIIPLSTFMSLYGWRYINSIIVKSYDEKYSDQIKQQIYQVLGKKHRFDPKDERAIAVWDMAEGIKIQDRVFLGIKIFLGVLGAMTLIVAGVGVANIMYVVVKERTREFGIKRAIGAKKRHIMLQIIFESLLIAAIGGAGGILLSYSIIKLIWMVPAGDGAMQFLGRPLMSSGVMLLSVSVLGVIGLMAGFFPAKKAAQVDPVEALRYE